MEIAIITLRNGRKQQIGFALAIIEYSEASDPAVVQNVFVRPLCVTSNNGSTPERHLTFGNVQVMRQLRIM